MTEAQTEAFTSLLEGIAIDVDADTFTHVLSNTLQRERTPLATSDDDLRRAATTAGVGLFKPA